MFIVIELYYVGFSYTILLKYQHDIITSIIHIPCSQESLMSYGY